MTGILSRRVSLYPVCGPVSPLGISIPIPVGHVQDIESSKPRADPFIPPTGFNDHSKFSSHFFITTARLHWNPVPYVFKLLQLGVKAQEKFTGFVPTVAPLQISGEC